MHRIPPFTSLFFTITNLSLLTAPALGMVEDERPPGVSTAQAEGAGRGRVKGPGRAEPRGREGLASPTHRGTARRRHTRRARTAEFVRDKLQEWGWEVEFAEYEVLLNEPDGVPSVTIIRPDHIELKVTEDAYNEDKDSASPDAWPAFHGYGISGDVTGQVVYVNYGTVDDFEALAKLGIEVEGKLVLARYGGIFRGLKVLNAQRRGAIGILIYSDPIDDGFARGDIYPIGPFRPASAIQRGSVQFLSLGPGDPSTPNGPSIQGAERLPFDRS